ncbi:MAG TPA: glycosyltransferase family 87 protein [Candidatus Binataceae bacterium]|nr:glycosyltransferase family 87 protein [Candidatus Binataceae bacterium]
MSKVTYDRAIIVSAVILAVLATIHVVTQLRIDSNRDTQFDFSSYYAWGSAFDRGEDVWAAPTTHDAHVPETPKGASNYTPFFVRAFAPLCLMNSWTAHLVWELIQIACIVLAMGLLTRSLEPPASVFVAMIFVSLAVMSRSSDQLLYFAQSAPILLLPMVASWLASRRGHQAIAGVLLALAMLLKLYPGILLGYYFCRRKWNAVGWTTALFVGGVIATRLKDWRGFVVNGFVTSGNAAVRYLPDKISVVNIILHFAGNAGLSVDRLILLAAILDLILVLILAWLTMQADDDVITDGLLFNLWTTAGILISPLSWHHELPLLFPMYFFTYWHIEKSFREKDYWMKQRWLPIIAVSLGSILLVLCIGREFNARLKHLIPTFLTPGAIFLGAAAVLTALILARHSQATSRSNLSSDREAIA